MSKKVERKYLDEKCNTRLKYYNGELVEVMRFERSVFSETKTPRKSKGGFSPEIDEPVEKSVENSDDARAQRRARTRVFDLCGCNPDLSIFVTLTLDGTKIDRYDYEVIVKKLNIWLDNRVRRSGLKYVMVAEFHKDKAIHFHALFNNALPLTPSGKKDKRGNEIYNLADWPYGFTTAVKLYGHKSAVCGYIVKYITKSDSKVGGRWFYHGGKLTEPSYEFLCSDITQEQRWEGFRSYDFTIAELGDCKCQVFKKEVFG